MNELIDQEIDAVFNHYASANANGVAYLRTYEAGFRRIARAIIEKDRAQRQAEPSDDYKRLLGDLLAIVHRDGGHYTAAHGFKKATEDAIRAVPMQRQAEPVALYIDAGHLREVLAGNDMPAFCSSEPGRGLVPLCTAPPAQVPEGTLDVCTDGNNCRRCQTRPKHRGSIPHAGIPVGNSYGAPDHSE